MAHGINVNVVHGWRKLSRQAGTAPVVMQQEFVPVTVAPTPRDRPDEQGVEIELRRGPVTMKITWPLYATRPGPPRP